MKCEALRFLKFGVGVFRSEGSRSSPHGLFLKLTRSVRGTHPSTLGGKRTRPVPPGFPFGFRESESESERERERVCVCVCVSESDRERVCVSESDRVCV